MKVIKHFQDKETNRFYRVGAEYEGDRTKELQEQGFLENDDTLEGNVKDVQGRITDDLSKEELEHLLEQEKDHDNRKTVVKHIESLLDEK